MDEGGIPTDPNSLKTAPEAYQPEGDVVETVVDLKKLELATRTGDDTSLAMRLTNVKHINKY